MNYYIWELNEERKEIIFNATESEMDEMEALSIDQFNDIVKRYPDYQLIDLDSYMIKVFSRASQKLPDGDVGLVNMLMRGFNAK